MTPTSHPNFTGDQEAAFVVAHYGDTHGLLIVVLSTTRSHGRGPSRARPLPALAEMVGPELDAFGAIYGIERNPPTHAYPRREVSIIDGTEFAASSDGRFLAFAGRCYGPGTPQTAVELHETRGLVGTLARLFHDTGAVDTTATEVR